MAIFTGTAADETITPTFVSGTVTRIPVGSFPSAAADSLDGGGGDDTLDGGAGDDSLIGGTGDDSLIGGTGNDTLSGGDGNDTLNGGTGADNMNGGLGDDIYVVDNVGDVAAEVAGGIDTVQASITHTLTANIENLTLTGALAINGTGNARDNVIIGNNADNVLSGLAGDDTLKGGGGADTLIGGDGNDILVGGLGADTMDGGFGDDLYIVDNVGDVAAEVAGGIDTVQASVTYALSVNLENLTLTGVNAINGTGNAKANVITGNGGSNALSGLAGNDTLSGGGGNDTLDGGTGADIMDGGLGNDTYIVDNAGDVTVEAAGGGTDTVQSLVTHTLSANIENLTLGGATAINGTGNALNNVINGNGANNVLAGLAGNDTLKGGGGADTLIGGDGNDTLIGGLGADTMDGGFGDDLYVVDNVGDVAGEVAGGVDTVQSSVTHTLSVNLENLTLTGTANINGTGNAKDNVITGNSGNNVLSGLAGDDTLSGLDGNDTLNGGTGADNMNGGFGDDLYIVDNVGDVAGEVAGGIDTVQSSVTHTLSVNLENLTLTGAGAINGTGNARDNVINGNAANNVLSGLAGNDTLNGGDGNDTLNGGAGADTMNGGFGNDLYIVDNVGDVAAEVAAGIDTVQSSVTHTLSVNLENLTLTGVLAINGTGNAKANVITGNAGSNVLSGLAGNDTLSGGGGNDTLDGGTGADTMDGGLGNDVYIVDNVGDVAAEVAGGIDTVLSSVTHTLSANIENLTLTGAAAINGTGNALNNVINGNAANNVLSGLAGNDTLNGGAGNDTLNGGTGNDTLNGGLGNDLYIVDNAGDVATDVAAGGIDTVQSSVTHTLSANIENLTLTGAAAINGTGNALNNVISGNAANNVLSGLAGNDRLLGNAGNDTLVGGDGNDTLDGGTGADNMNGGFGDDLYVVDNVGDVAGEVAGGIDTVLSSVTHTLSVNLENLTLTGAAAINGTGNALNNVITGNNAANVLSGLAGNDTLVGNAGNDTLVGGDGNDTLNGGTGSDNMNGGFGDDLYIVDSAGDIAAEVAGGIDTVQSSVSHTLSANMENLTLTGAAAINGTGNARDNVITGNGADNVLSGLAGNDRFITGGGNDALIGGDGNDVFQFDSPLVADNFVTIVDFTVGSDSIALSAGIFTQAGPVGALAANAFFLGAAAADADDRIGYDPATGNLIYDTDGSGTADVGVAFGSLTPGLAMTESQFTIV